MGLLEAMAAGVPAVASRVGGVPEVAPEGTAQLVAPGDPPRWRGRSRLLLDDPALARAQAAAARTHVEAHLSARPDDRAHAGALHRARAGRHEGLAGQHGAWASAAPSGSC